MAPVRFEESSNSPVAIGGIWMEGGGSAPVAPVATNATNVLFTSFSANWNSSAGATSYRLDVATDSGFSSFVTGFNNLNVGNVTTYSVTGLLSTVTYYYRVRAVGSSGTSPNSNTISVTTATWPSGVDGALTINGTTVHLAQGAVKNYSSVSITNSGVLVIDAGDAWTIIGCSGNFTIDATSVIQGSLNQSGGETLTATAPDGTSLSYTISQQPGGDGGQSGSGCCSAQGGGSQSNGNGGGGGGAGVGGAADSSDSGAGGGSGDLAQGGPALNIFTDGFGVVGNNGQDNSFFGGGSGCSGTAAAGGGATRGYHGSPLYMKVAGTVTVPAATVVVDLHGSNGASGGASGSTGFDTTGVGGQGAGGGGGSAGGTGGNFVFRAHSLGNMASGSVNVTAGSGGTGGASGGPAGSCGQDTATNGGDGSGGSTGVTDIATY